MTAGDTLLELVDVTKQYESPDGGAATEVLRGISLRLGAGESLAVVGPSGSGKSTLLNLIGALDQPTSGTLRLDGVDLGQLDERQLAGVRARRVGLVFQLHHLLPQCTVWENVLIPTLAAGGADEAAERRAADLLGRVGLSERLTHRPGQLSAGQCQRTAVVRALMNSPKLLLADEPTGSLDRATAEDLADLLVELNAQDGVTLILATHSMPLAARMAKVLQLRDGVLSPA